jgi:hypothetical protein
VVVNDRLILGVLVVQALSRLVFQQETLIKKGLHGLIVVEAKVVGHDVRRGHLVAPHLETVAIAARPCRGSAHVECPAETLLPPILKPLPLLPAPAVVAPMLNAQEFFTVTGEVQPYRSNPSSALSQDRQPSKTFPDPAVAEFSLAQKPSALAPPHGVSAFWCESQLRIVLFMPLSV